MFFSSAISVRLFVWDCNIPRIMTILHFVLWRRRRCGRKHGIIFSEYNTVLWVYGSIFRAALIYCSHFIYTLDYYVIKQWLPWESITLRKKVSWLYFLLAFNYGSRRNALINHRRTEAGTLHPLAESNRQRTSWVLRSLRHYKSHISI